VTLRFYTVEEKLREIERLIIFEKRSSGYRNEILKSIASDLRARMPAAPSTAVRCLEERLLSLKRSTDADSRIRAQTGVVQEFVGRWPLIKQALEVFEAEEDCDAKQ